MIVRNSPDSMAHTVIFVDAGVESFRALASALSSQGEVVVLDTREDGLQQIAAYLTGRFGIDSLHLISHGSPGTLYLGSSVLDGESVGAYAAQLQTIGRSLSVTADILLFGCNVAEGDAG